ncbi:FGGY carbohydrate kinase domain-containing protein [Orchesella cincta]|uniref:FGGY carbohydrate kinase domain-containing protein n=1 Tax=Orchesella cincta TaxID=48709 RepID=A0A1D2MSJ2_ORCCI|nr:FGGY carbohydrate kinase domain-containing protein [Orchesella cincta]
MGKYVIGVDCGSGSVRAGLFDVASGELLNTAVKDILINNPEPDYYEQSSDDIWNAVIITVKQVLVNINAEDVTGISFCATCSLVALGTTGKPESVSKSGDSKWNIVMWMDHRAGEEANAINATNHSVLKYVGGSISLEMETPKLLWLKKNLPTNYRNTEQFFDLGDFLRWKASGSLSRSVCCIVCKWTHVNEEGQNFWDESYFSKVGLTDALPKIGNTFSFPGDSVQISAEAAKELGLGSGVKVGFSQIDAHSGVLGMIGCGNVPQERVGLGRLALISGTSTCHMALSPKSVMVPGVWGPYYGVILKDMYLSEAGQSAAGKLLDHVVMSHVAYPELAKECNNSVGKVLSYLEDVIRKEANPNALTEDLHIWPDYHGNRSPLADPTLKGMISGLTLSNTRTDLAALYLATIQALTVNTEVVTSKRKWKRPATPSKSWLSVGVSQNQNFISKCTLTLSVFQSLFQTVPSPVLLGAAMSAAAAVGTEVRDIVSKMAGGCSIIQPNASAKGFHDRKYRVFLQMVADQKKYREIMKS